MMVKTAFDFSNQWVLVTGSSTGLGRAIAVEFAQNGANVLVHYHHNLEGAEETVEQIAKAGGKAILTQADLCAEQAVEALFANISRECDNLDVLVNNAGIYPLRGLLEMSVSEWDGMMSANLRSAFLCTQFAARGMRDSGGGSIVNIASIEACMPARMHAHYNTSKAGILMLTRSSALELGEFAIRVNAVSPGLIYREGLEEAWPEGLARWEEHCPLGRVGQAEEVAKACVFLASDMAAWISGVNLVVDGGMSVVGGFS